MPRYISCTTARPTPTATSTWATSSTKSSRISSSATKQWPASTAPYVPGWDCHGLPIESKVVTELGDKIRQLSKPEIRGLCKKYASKYIKLQGQQFQQLGVFGDFENPYLTFKPVYEAGVLEVFAELVDKGLVKKQLKPIHWSVGCETALAEAEFEYKDIDSPSIFVNFPSLRKILQRNLDGLGLLNRTENSQCFLYDLDDNTLDT